MEGLTAGGDDYLTKPYQLSVLSERVKRLLDKTSLMPQTIYKGLLRIEVAPQQAFINDMDLLLTQKEFSVLLFLLQREGQTMGAEYLYKQIWGQRMGDDDSTIRKTLSKVRKKLEKSGYTISVKYNEGYCFEPE
jgi:DNA-binding response OmpR family regulator